MNHLLTCVTMHLLLASTAPGCHQRTLSSELSCQLLKIYKCAQVKKNTIGATLGKDVPLNKKKSQAVRKLAMCSTKSSVRNLHTQRWFKKSEKRWSTTNCLEVNNCLRSHFSHEKYLYDKKDAHSSAKILKQIVATQFLNDFALQCRLSNSYHLTIFYSRCNSK